MFFLHGIIIGITIDHTQKQLIIAQPTPSLFFKVFIDVMNVRKVLNLKFSFLLFHFITCIDAQTVTVINSNLWMSDLKNKYKLLICSYLYKIITCVMSAVHFSCHQEPIIHLLT